jgi:peptidoglycan/xylan/chitin deacetylase (PgdA/CDA1 family)
MNVFVLRLISIGIIWGIIFINLRTFYGFIQPGNQQSEKPLSHQDKNPKKWNLEVSQVDKKKHCYAISPQKIRNPSWNRVILRLDNISSNTPTALLKKLIIDTGRFHAPMVLWIRPEWLDTQSELANFLRNESCNFEIAIHGWDHFSAQVTTGNIRRITEFSEISYEDALTRINKARSVLNKLTTESAITFIPPFGEISNSWILAAKQSWIAIISSMGTWVFDVRTQNSDNTFSSKNIQSGCLESFKSTNLCIVRLQIEDFVIQWTDTVDEKKYFEYLWLLSDFSMSGTEYTTFRKLKETWPDFFRYSLLK